jgi:hypothetical protein
VRPTHRTQPYRAGEADRPQGQVLQAMTRGRAFALGNPQDILRAGQSPAPAQALAHTNFRSAFHALLSARRANLPRK